MKTGYISNQMMAQSWELWREYIDPDATMTKDEFDAMTVEDRIRLIEVAFDDDYDEDTNPDGVDTYHAWDCKGENA